MEPKLVPLPHERRERGWINWRQYIIDLTSCSTYRHFSSTCKWYLLFVNDNCKLNLYLATKESPPQYFCRGDYCHNTVCLGKTLSNWRLLRWISRAGNSNINFLKTLHQQTFVLMKTSSRRRQDVFIKTNIFTNISRRLQKTSSFQDVFIETNVCWDYIKLSHVSLVLLIQLCNRPCSHYTVWLFVASPVVYWMGLLFTLETNISAHYLYRIAVEALCSSKWYITKRYLQRSDFLYNFSNVNRISY